MRKLTKDELHSIKESLFKGEQFTVEVEDFNFAEFDQQLADLDEDDNGDQAAKVDRRPTVRKV